MTKLALTAVILLLATPALAEEKPVKLKDAPGRGTVESNCGTCHSLDYIRTNSAFQKPDTWRAEVTKMVNVFGADIKPEDQAKIIDYLIANYGAQG